MTAHKISLKMSPIEEQHGPYVRWPVVRSHWRNVQTDLVGTDRAVPIKSFVRGGNLNAAPSSHCAARKSPKRLALSNFDRLVFARLYRIATRIVNALLIVQPATVICWHRTGFRLF
jgi:hypothetical protein